MKVLFKTSYSSNNLKVFKLTFDNHADYCSRHGYTYMPVDEPYSPRMDLDELEKCVKEYDIVCTIGVDLLIQYPDCLLEDFYHPGITLCKEVGPTLNGDFILWGGEEGLQLIEELRKIEGKHWSTQAALNNMHSRKVPNIHLEPMMQIAAPSMNPNVDYTNINVDDYFALHYHTLGADANVGRKYERLKEDLDAARRD